ncbi:response regulator [Mucilaginibacter gossypii]|uniref:response regulator n=1 Tax=Mucilaginibacter gossypii TaxID=551996 RepID=UPI000DCD9698|nr:MULTISPECIES: response regulator [Mucilaginibacter]QTE38813.1 response regulator [Mucilaginibacter gossypii]RAV55111.1 hypothetical protein DIU36_18070 [Mucilaginibacter rubeus]
MREHPVDCLDVIFLDIRMPRFDGWDFFEGFKDLYPALPVKPLLYVFSPSIDPTDREQVLTTAMSPAFLASRFHDRCLSWY